MSFISNISDAFATDETADRGSLVETVLIIAGFSIVAILVVTWIGGAIAGQASNVSKCIAGANGQDVTSAQDTCTNNNGVSDSIDAKINSQKGDRF